ncbi:MAG: hypothetical protein EOO40_00590 [Deltaproteobacteria bacterium]|nr:MAG: hypothetical protein EOO40_00590 [Deltaproteobacteria bacterium]
MQKQNTGIKDVAVSEPPGFLLAKLIDQKRLSDGDVVVMCASLDISARDLCRLLVGNLQLDDGLANRLQRYFGSPSADTWLDKEQAYRAGGQPAEAHAAERGIV